MLEIVLAYAAGLLTLINPCVLPLLPLIAAGAVARHRLGPVAMASGMAISFVVAGMGAFWLSRAIGIAPEDIAVGAGWVMVAFGVAMLVPFTQAGFARLAGAVAGGGTRGMMAVEGRGLWGEAASGALMGLAWSPCIGPTLGAAIGFAAQGENLFSAFVIMVGFALGSATVFLGLSYGARGIIARRREALAAIAPHAKTVLAIGLIVVGLAVVFRLDRLAEAAVLSVLPPAIADFSVSL